MLVNIIADAKDAIMQHTKNAPDEPVPKKIGIAVSIEDTINGILMGSIYGLTAMGLTIIFGVLKVVNFAHGSILMVGMYLAYWVITLSGIHPYLAIVLVAPAMFLFGYTLQNFVIKPIFIAEKNVRELLTVIIVTTGIWYILDNMTLSDRIVVIQFGKKIANNENVITAYPGEDYVAA